MKIAIIGANSPVATELCLLLQGKQREVIPVVRNVFGTAFLNQRGFKCRVADASKEGEIKKAISDVDAVVIAAYKWPEMTMSPKETQDINRKMAENIVKNAPQNAVVVYLSTIKVFSKKLDPSISKIGFRPQYDKEKKQLERLVKRECKKMTKKCFVLRLGHVYGNNQKATKRVLELVEGKTKISLAVPEGKVSNIVHTVTVAEAILKCSNAQVKSGKYTVVNQPQWTWKEVYAYHAKPDAKIVCVGSKKGRKQSMLFKKLVESAIKNYSLLRRCLPRALDLSLQYKYRKKKIQEEISALEEKPIASPTYEYNPAPGPYLEGLTETKKLLEKYEVTRNIFLPH